MTRLVPARSRSGRHVPAAVTLALLLAGRGGAVTLPARVYSTLDGLPGNRVNRILRDSRGFLWFATDRGLARFDGTRFSAYGPGEGLPEGEINDVAETSDGALWIAADKGVYRLRPAAARGAPGPLPFASIRTGNRALSAATVLETRSDGGVRVGTQDGVFEERAGALVTALPALPRRIWDDHSVAALAATSAGEWIGTLDALWLGPSSGAPPRRFELGTNIASWRVDALLRDRTDRLWIGTWNGLFRLEPGSGSDVDPFDPRRQLSSEPVEALYERSDGTVIAAARHALLEFSPSGGVARTPAEELGPLFADVEPRCLAEDPAGNLWVGTAGGGAVRIDREGFVRYGREDGLGAMRAPALFLRTDGSPCAQLVSAGRILIACFDGTRFHTVAPMLPGAPPAGWGAAQLALEDRLGRLWLPTGEGLFRYPARKRLEDLARTPPERVFDRKNGLLVDGVFRVFDSGDGDLWVSTASPQENLLARWKADSDRIEPISEEEGPARTNLVTAIGKDAEGAIWLGTNGAGLWHGRDGRFERIVNGPNLPGSSWITSIFLDHEDRLWVSTDREGLFRFAAPSARVPSARRITTADGLSSMDIRGIAEDRFSRMYALTSSGVDRLGERPGSVEHFTAADGLPGGALAAISADAVGRIWVSGDGGISVLRPLPPSPGPPVEVAFDDVEVSGERVPIPLRGDARVSGLALPAGRNSLRFGIASLAWEPRRPIAYRYRLDARSPWSAVPPDRAIVLPRLAAGGYRLEVEGVDSAGAAGRAAIAEFSIAAPLWRRPGFVLLAAAILAAGAVMAHRARLEQLMRVERIRTRIAADLHDDIGAGLSEVAVLAEVVRRRLGEDDPESRSLMEEVARTARQLVDSMSEIVWSVDPRRDDLESLLARLRHFAATLAEARGIRFSMDVTDDVTAVPLEAGRRRDLYLLLKEAAHNAVRHAGAARVSLAISVDHGTLKSEVVDDGRGFDPAAGKGHGLDTMRERARALGGTLELASSRGEGTRVSISVPLAGPP